MSSNVLKWVLGGLSLFLLVGLIFVAKHLWGGDPAYREGYVYRDGQYVKVQRAHSHRHGDRDDGDDRDDDDHHHASGQSSYWGRLFKGFRKSDDD